MPPGCAAPPFYESVIGALTWIRSVARYIIILVWPLYLTCCFNVPIVLVVYCTIQLAVFGACKVLYSATLLQSLSSLWNTLYFSFIFFILVGYCPLDVVTVPILAALASASALWCSQYLIWTYASADSVIVLPTSHSSGDSAHLVVKIGSCAAVFELFADVGDGTMSTKGRIVEIEEKFQRERLARITRIWNTPLWIPFMHEGVVATCAKTFAEVRAIYDELNKGFRWKYNKSTQSCQEFALKLAYRVLQRDESDRRAIDLGVKTMTDFKRELVVFVVYAVAIAACIYQFVVPYSTIDYRHLYEHAK